ncbi:mitochondrial inner membrane protease subunit 1 [Microplitis demolitor]|uniref:mitochondrial inner membrane protease subunit 1 n=1 Tax=Microplitis demolitor TaxID=69319 RepID=UPI0004CD42B9|nr:mitochondrial inner membrane protease subunit 1 [Microplitis demolitor]
MIKNLFFKILSTVGTVINYSCVTHCALKYVGDFTVCNGPSMEPTIHTNDILFTEHISPRCDKLSKGDIIIAKCPTNPRENICKRIRGVEGDKIYYGFTSYVVPQGHLWLEGDNSSNSSDSRSYGPIPKGLVISRAVCKVWPFSDITFFNK